MPFATKTPTLSELDAAKRKADFPILQQSGREGGPLVYLDSAASSQRPRQVLDAMRSAEESAYANVHRGSHYLSDRATEMYEDARETARTFINAEAVEEVVFVRGTTEGINLVARSWGDANVGPGDEILLTLLEHHSNIVPWQQLAARTGAVIRWLPLLPDGSPDVERLSEFLTERTKVFAFTAVSNVLGVHLPVADWAAAARDVGAITVVDAAQAAPHEVVDVQAWGADFVAFSGHKLCGPSGVGVLYGRRGLLDAMSPFQGGGSMIHAVTTEGFSPAQLPAKFEAGTPAIIPAIGLAAAMKYVQAVGLANIAKHERSLAAAAVEALQQIPGVRILGPAGLPPSGIVCFNLENAHANDVAEILDARGVAVRAGHHCAMPLHAHFGLPTSARASFYLYNTPEDATSLAAGVAAAAKMLA